MSDKDESKRFVEKARELGCDKDEAQFDVMLAKLADAKPKPTPKKKRRDKRR